MSEEMINFSEKFGISKKWLNDLYPFFMVMDEYCGVVDCGDLLLKAVKDLELNQGIDNFFEFEFENEEENGEKEITMESLISNQNKLVVFIGKLMPLKLRGEIKHYPESKYSLFLCTPKVTKKNQLTRYGIKFEELPLSDPTRNYVESLEEE